MIFQYKIHFRIKNIPELATKKLHTKQWKYRKNQKQQKYQGQYRIDRIHERLDQIAEIFCIACNFENFQ